MGDALLHSIHSGTSCHAQCIRTAQWHASWPSTHVIILSFTLPMLPSTIVPLRLDHLITVCDEDPTSTTIHTQSLLVEQSLVATVAQDTNKPSIAPRFCSLLEYLQLRGTSYRLLAVPIPGLQWTLTDQYYRASSWHWLCMQPFPADATCSSCQAPMRIFDNHALLSLLWKLQFCRLPHSPLPSAADPWYAYTTGVESPHPNLECSDAPESGWGYGPTKPADVCLTW